MAMLRCLAVLLGTLLTVVTAAAAGGQPRIVFPEKSHSFAPVLEGTDVTHDFVFENRGTGPLEITGVRTD